MERTHTPGRVLRRREGTAQQLRATCCTPEAVGARPEFGPAAVYCGSGAPPVTPSSPMHEYLEQLLLVLAVGSAVAIGAKRAGIPYNVALVVVGLLLVLMNVLPQTPMNPDVVLLVFLPMLVFQGALSSDDVRMRRHRAADARAQRPPMLS